MHGHKPPSPEAPPNAVIPRWYLLAGDILLVALALLIVFKSPHPLSWQREVFCAALVMLAALLAVIALWIPQNKAAVPNQQPLRAGTGVMPKGKSPEEFRNDKTDADHSN
jgi:protein-S-isoprenylcysteine O-methyltransferase Ste14